VAVNGTGADVTLTFQNFDTTQPAVLAMNNTLQASAQFEVVAGSGANPCTPMKIIPQAANATTPSTCTFVARFKPVGGAGTFIPGTVTVNADIGAAVGGVVGEVQSTGILRVTTIPPGGGFFGEVDLNTSTPDRTWIITNTGETATGVLTV